MLKSKYAKRLDRSRDHGSNHPPENGVFFWQDGVPFNHEGIVVDAVAEAVLEPEQLRKLAPAKKPAPAPVPAKHHNAPPTPPKPPAPGSEGGENEEADALNLEMWLRGEAEYSFGDVQQAVKVRHSVWKTSKRDLILFLVEEIKLVASGDLAPDFQTLIGGE